LSEEKTITGANQAVLAAAEMGSEIVGQGEAGLPDPIHSIIIEVVNLMRTYSQVHLKELLGILDEMEKPLETFR
jgi:hypothetical protein